MLSKYFYENSLQSTYWKYLFDAILKINNMATQKERNAQKLSHILSSGDYQCVVFDKQILQYQGHIVYNKSMSVFAAVNSIDA